MHQQNFPLNGRELEHSTHKTALLSNSIIATVLPYELNPKNKPYNKEKKMMPKSNRKYEIIGLFIASHTAYT